MIRECIFIFINNWLVNKLKTIIISTIIVIKIRVRVKNYILFNKNLYKSYFIIIFRHALDIYKIC